MDRKIIRSIKTLIVLSIILAVGSCSTKKNTGITRTYHNITAYYNVYYNALDAFKTGVKKIEENHIDNYSVTLPLFFFSDDQAVRSAFGDMNRAIEKGSKCVRKHSITTKPKKKSKKNGDKEYQEFYNQREFVKWVDDSYMLIGKANFYKKDYYPAIETFNYVIREYNEKPIKYEAYLWLARCYAEMGKYDEADNFLSTLKSDKNKIDESLTGPIALTQAYILIKLNEIDAAIPFLEKAIENTKKKKEKTRYTYVLAQLYQQNGQIKKAFDAYGKVVDMNPAYQMVFNARINRASIFNASAEDSKPLQKELYKMLKDEKNIDFKDQIYYALGSIAYNESRDEDALGFYLKSASVSTENTNQKAVSFLAAADMYFDRPDYRNSQAYYDSAVSFLDNDYPNYLSIKRKSENLNALVENIIVIETQDSLQRIATMPEAARNAFLDGLIAQVFEQEKLEKEMAAQQQQDLVYMQQQGRVNQQDQSGKWYFYNPSMLSMGQAEFKTKWGERKQEDNWRRRNKRSVDFDAFAENTNTTDTAQNVFSNKSREYYLVDLPLTDSALQVSKEKVEGAYFDIATIYKERFGDFDLSIKSYLSLLEEFPETEYRLSSYYNLYKLYLLNKEYDQAESYKQKIIAEYPDSEYTKVLSNPNYFKELEKIENQVKFMYQATYKYFINDNCDEVNYNFQYVDSAFPQSKLLPKFALLNTLCIGHLGDSAVFKDSLNSFITKFSGSEEEGYAKEVLAALDRDEREVILEEEKVEQFGGDLAANVDMDSLDVSIFNFKPEIEHYYIAVIANEKADANRAKFNLVNFNLDYYDFLSFEVESELLSADYSLVVVKKFKNQKMAYNYYESLRVATEVYEDFDEEGYRDFIISIENFNKFREDKNLLRYQKFFNINY
ncbi:MAG: tetratricopeptide repeat protein [Salinivirgaceae bacterium]|nr:tetratricopeptide repeat protein [Salinivirgaceae bacterium]